VFTRQNRQRIGADFVRHVAIAGNAVRADDDASDTAGFQEVAGHVVGDQGGGDAVLYQFPDGQARALQEGAGFVRGHIDLLSGVDGRADYAERVPYPAVARAPALQWVRTVLRSGTNSAPWRPIARLM